jgi:hypothetical protein
MDIVENVLQGGLAPSTSSWLTDALPESLNSLDPLVAANDDVGSSSWFGLATDPILGPPRILDIPRDELRRLRMVFFDVVVTDCSSDAPFAWYLERLKSECLSEVTKRLSYEGRRADWAEWISSGREASMQEIAKDWRRDHPNEGEAAITETAARIQREMERRLLEEGPRKPLTNDDRLRALRQAAESLKAQDSLVPMAEEVAYRLRLHTLPHEWFIEMLCAEGRDFLDGVESRSWGRQPFRPFHGLESLPWRNELNRAPRRPEVLVRLFATDTDQEIQNKVDNALKQVRQLKAPSRGRKTWDGRTPSDKTLAEMLYRHLRGASYKQLAVTEGDFHPKTIQKRLRQLSSELFAEDQSSGAE